MADKRQQAGELADGIGARLRAAREERGYTQALFAEMLGISVEAVSRLERGVSKPSVETVITICLVTEVGPAELLGLQLPSTQDGAAGPADRRTQLVARIEAGLPAVDDAGLELVWRLVSYARQQAGDSA